MSQWANDQVGDNIEFTAVAIGDYEIWLSHNTKNSSNDTEFTKYSDVQLDTEGGFGVTARKFTIRTNQTADLVELDGIAFTNPAAIIKNKAHIETRNTPSIFKMKIRTATANTTVKVRWF